MRVEQAAEQKSRPGTSLSDDAARKGPSHKCAPVGAFYPLHEPSGVATRCGRLCRFLRWLNSRVTFDASGLSYFVCYLLRGRHLVLSASSSSKSSCSSSKCPLRTSNSGLQQVAPIQGSKVGSDGSSACILQDLLSSLFSQTKTVGANPLKGSQLKIREIVTLAISWQRVG